MKKFEVSEVTSLWGLNSPLVSLSFDPRALGSFVATLQRFCPDVGTQVDWMNQFWIQKWITLSCMLCKHWRIVSLENCLAREIIWVVARFCLPLLTYWRECKYTLVYFIIGFVSSSANGSSLSFRFGLSPVLLGLGYHGIVDAIVGGSKFSKPVVVVGLHALDLAYTLLSDANSFARSRSFRTWLSVAARKLHCCFKGICWLYASFPLVVVLLHSEGIGEYLIWYHNMLKYTVDLFWLKSFWSASGFFGLNSLLLKSEQGLATAPTTAEASQLNYRASKRVGESDRPILEKLPVSEGGKASKQALDMALSELTSDPLFPQGLAWISAATLAESRKRILGSLLGALDLRDGQLTSVLTVACEMDGDGLTDHFKQVLSSDKGYSLAGNELEVKKKRGNPSYIDKQRDNIRQSEVLVLPCSNAFGEKTVGEAANGQGELGKDGLGSESIRHVGSRGTNENSNNRLSDFVIQEITKRHLAVACKASLETGLGVLMDSVTRTKDKRIENEIWEDNLSSASTSSGLWAGMNPTYTVALPLCLKGSQTAEHLITVAISLSSPSTSGSHAGVEIKTSADSVFGSLLQCLNSSFKVAILLYDDRSQQAGFPLYLFATQPMSMLLRVCKAVVLWGVVSATPQNTWVQNLHGCYKLVYNKKKKGTRWSFIPGPACHFYFSHSMELLNSLVKLS
eukprot:Gb_15513 [translate_table: standard]